MKGPATSLGGGAFVVSDVGHYSYSRLMTGQYLLDNLWMPIVVALVLAGLSALVSSTVRDKVWKPFGRALRWPFRLRLTTTVRRATEATDRADLELNAQTYAASARNAREVARQEIEAEKLRSRLFAEAAQQQREQEVMDARRQSLAEGLEAGRAEALAEIAAERAVPSVTPTWQVKDEGEFGWTLLNAQHNAYVSDVSIRAHVQQFAFTSATQWAGRFHGQAPFDGRVLTVGSMHGVRFTIDYRDERGDLQSGEAFIDRQPLAGFGAVYPS